MKLLKHLFLFAIGAVLYAAIELLWRGYTHWTMAVIGGIAFLAIGGINNWFSWTAPLLVQVIIGTLLITTIELVAGIILNKWLNLGIWDYSQMPGNFFGLICPQFSAAWSVLSFIAILLDDWLRYFLWGEERPHYKLLRWK